jgi:hypothetical protein
VPHDVQKRVQVLIDGHVVGRTRKRFLNLSKIANWIVTFTRHLSYWCFSTRRLINVPSNARTWCQCRPEAGSVTASTACPTMKFTKIRNTFKPGIRHSKCPVQSTWLTLSSGAHPETYT